MFATTWLKFWEVISIEERLALLGKLHNPGLGPKYVRAFYDAVVKMEPEVILELGVGCGTCSFPVTGVSTRAFLLGLKRAGKGHLYSCDIAGLDQKLEKVIEDWGLKEFWTFIHMDDRDLGKWLWSRPIDILYVDTDHKCEHTVEELEVFSSHVKENGLILLHETRCEAHPGVDMATGVFLMKHEEWKYEDVLMPEDLIGCDRGLGCLRRVRQT